MIFSKIINKFFNYSSSQNLNINKNEKMPNHIAFVMDGNRRWAKENFLPKSIGYSKGIDSMLEKIKFGLKNNIKYMTFYCMSKDNLNRSSEDLDDFFSNIRVKLKELNLEKILENQVLVKILGNLDYIPKDIKTKIESIISTINKSTKDPKIRVNLAIGYSSRDEIVSAVKGMIDSKVPSENITTNLFSQFLFTKDTPDPDLFIRTGKGNKRLSDFLLWQLSYTELYFIDKYWPDFDEKDLYIAILDFRSRNRNYGR